MHHHFSDDDDEEEDQNEAMADVEALTNLPPLPEITGGEAAGDAVAIPEPLKP